MIDTGGLNISSEVGDIWTGAENATKMELEEKLYDRFSITVGGNSSPVFRFRG